MEIDPSTIQTASGLSTLQGVPTELNFDVKEIECLRELAKKVRYLSSQPIEEQKRKLWLEHNDLGNTRPLIFCDPENGWNEVIRQDDLLCQDYLARVWEMHLRKEIFWAEKMLDDKVIEAKFAVPYFYRDTGWGLVVNQIGGGHGGSCTWESPIRNYDEDFPKLRHPEIIIDYDKTRKTLDYAEEIFGKILNVELKGVWWWTLGMTMDVVFLRGLTNFMYDIYDNPDSIHKLMEFLKQSTMKKLDFLESNKLLTLNTEGTYVGSGGFGWTKELPRTDYNERSIRCIDMWGFSESQETVGLSSEMFEEFIFPYQLPILERFGLNCYGCCEPIDQRWDVVKRIPRLRRVSSSPWANQDTMAEFLGKDYIISAKPSPAPLSIKAADTDSMRTEIKRIFKATKGCIVELIMKDNHTIGNDPDNLINWCRIAREEADNI